MLRIATIIALAFLLPASPALADRDSALVAVKSDGPVVKDATWTPAGWLYVGVLDNGSPRHGLAQYFCEILAEHEVRGAYVKIIDIAKVAGNQGFHELGRARCPG